MHIDPITELSPNFTGGFISHLKLRMHLYFVVLFTEVCQWNAFGSELNGNSR